MEMQQIRYFLTLAQTLNFTHAAEECHVTQPALTRAIQALEASCFWVYAYPALLRYAAHSAGGYWARISPQASEMVS